MKKLGLYVIFSIPILFSFLTKIEHPEGTYELLNQEFGGQRITLYKNGTFTENISGCVYSLRYSGIVKVKKDVLILRSQTVEDLRSGKVKKNRKWSKQYLFKNDTLFPFNDANAIETDEYHALVKVH